VSRAVDRTHAASLQKTVDAVLAREHLSQILFFDGLHILEGAPVMGTKTLIECKLLAAFRARSHDGILAQQSSHIGHQTSAVISLQ
jgi:hypothetical protein